MASKNETLEVLRDALIIRKKITSALKYLMLRSQKRVDELYNELAKAVDENYMKIQEQLRLENFNQWLVKEECRNVADIVARLTDSLRTANTIWPSYMEEFIERRIHMDRAMGACNVLQNELQYIADTEYADKNKFTPLALEIQELFLKVKKLRQSDNRFKKNF